MNDPDADSHIVSGIQDVEGTGWRWTHDQPKLRFRLPSAEGWKFAMDIGLPEPNLKKTGPLTISVFVNGRLLDKTRYTTPGDRRFEKPVPAAFIDPSKDTVVLAVVDPPWVSPADGNKLGFVLHRAGFVR